MMRCREVRTGLRIVTIGLPYRMWPQLFRNTGGGRFADVSGAAGPYFQGEWLGRGAAFGDLDNDGATDIVVTHLERPPALLRNVTERRGHWIRLILRAAGGRSPIDARVAVEAGGRTLVRIVAAGTSYLSSSDRRVLVDLGEADLVDRIEVRWPAGRIETWPSTVRWSSSKARAGSREQTAAASRRRARGTGRRRVSSWAKVE